MQWQKMKTDPKNSVFNARKAGILLFWLVIWQIASIAVNSRIILVGPVETIICLAGLIGQASFWKTVLFSVGRIYLALLIGGVIGGILGVLCWRFRFAQELLSPPLRLMRTVPVASFVVLALIWFGSKKLTLFVVCAVVIPIFAANTTSGLKSADGKLLEMAEVFHMPWVNRIRYIYWPSLLPHLKNAMILSAGMSWKSGVAAEVIGVPDWSIGERIYMSKIYLETDQLFAWTIVIILLSLLTEKILLALIGEKKTSETKNPEARTSEMRTGGDQ